MTPRRRGALIAFAVVVADVLALAGLCGLIGAALWFGPDAEAAILSWRAAP